MCCKKIDKLKERLLHEKKPGLDCFENFQSIERANVAKLKKDWAKTKSGKQAGKYALGS